MKRTGRVVDGAFTLLVAWPLMLRAQASLERSDTILIKTVAVEYARHELLSPTERPILLLKGARAPTVTRDSTTVAALRHALAPDTKNGADTLVCSSATRSCTPDRSTQFVRVGDVSAAGDSAFVTVSVIRASGIKDATFSWRASEYVVVRRGGRWVVDHVRLKSAI